MIASFQIFDPRPCHFPGPSVPLLAPPGTASFGSPNSRTFRLIGSSSFALRYSRGRYALCDAYRLAGVNAATALLAPAYHCRTMLDPAVRLGCEILLYPSTPMLEPDWDTIRILIESSPRPVKALLVTHYFGIRQSLATARTICDRYGLALIEDCSHAFLYSGKQEAPGQFADFLLASPYKSFPARTVGC